MMFDLETYVPEGQMTVARRFIAGLLSCVTPGRSENRLPNVQTAATAGAKPILAVRVLSFFPKFNSLYLFN